MGGGRVNPGKPYGEKKVHFPFIPQKKTPSAKRKKKFTGGEKKKRTTSLTRRELQGERATLPEKDDDVFQEEKPKKGLGSRPGHRSKRTVLAAKRTSPASGWGRRGGRNGKVVEKERCTFG